MLAAFCAILGACGARSNLVDGTLIPGAPIEPQDMDPACVPAATTPFAQRFGDDKWQVGASIAIDSNGYPIIAGTVSGTLDLGFATLSASHHDPGSDSAFATPPLYLAGRFFVARLAPAGCTPFARVFEGTYAPASIEVTLAGDAILFTTSYYGRVDFGGGLMGPDDGLGSGAIVKLNAGGEHVYSHVFHADQLAIPRPAADAQGNVYVAGTFMGDLTFDDAALGSSTQVRTDAFVAKLDPSGALLWSKILRLDANWTYAAVRVAAWPEGDVAVAGQFAGLYGQATEIDLGDGPMSGPAQRGFVTSFDASGQHRWHSLLSPLVVDARLAPSGDLVIVGGWDGVAHPLQRFDTTGATSKAKMVHGPASIVSLAVGPDDEVLLAGALIPPGNGPIATAVAASGEVLWNRTFDAQSDGGNYRVAGAFGPSGTPWLVGGFTGSMDLGSGAISAEGEWPDVFVAALPP